MVSDGEERRKLRGSVYDRNLRNLTKSGLESSTPYPFGWADPVADADSATVPFERRGIGSQGSRERGNEGAREPGSQGARERGIQGSRARWGLILTNVSRSGQGWPSRLGAVANLDQFAKHSSRSMVGWRRGPDLDECYANWARVVLSPRRGDHS